MSDARIEGPAGALNTRVDGPEGAPWIVLSHSLGKLQLARTLLIELPMLKVRILCNL